jgi:hypothetical protein
VDGCEKVNWGINYQGNIRFLKKLIFKELVKCNTNELKNMFVSAKFLGFVLKFGL